MADVIKEADNKNIQMLPRCKSEVRLSNRPHVLMILIYVLYICLKFFFFNINRRIPFFDWFTSCTINSQLRSQAIQISGVHLIIHCWVCLCTLFLYNSSPLFSNRRIYAAYNENEI